MEVTTPDGRVLSDEPIDGEIFALAEKARHVAKAMDRLRESLAELDATLKVYESPGAVPAQASTKTKTEVEVSRKLIY